MAPLWNTPSIWQAARGNTTLDPPTLPSPLYTQGWNWSKTLNSRLLLLLFIHKSMWFISYPCLGKSSSQKQTKNQIGNGRPWPPLLSPQKDTNWSSHILNGWKLFRWEVFKTDLWEFRLETSANKLPWRVMGSTTGRTLQHPGDVSMVANSCCRERTRGVMEGCYRRGCDRKSVDLMKTKLKKKAKKGRTKCWGIKADKWLKTESETTSRMGKKSLKGQILIRVFSALLTQFLKDTEQGQT